MSTFALPPTRVLADHFAGQASLVRDIALVVGGACSVGLLAQVSIPMWPVPITGSTLGVMLVGAMLGSRRGAASLTTYAVGGLVGIPWFSDAVGGVAALARPSFGFIVAFIPTAYLIGWLSERRWDRRPGTSLVAFGAASLLPFLIGVPWMWANLQILTGKTLGLWETLDAGFIRFIPGGIVKWLLASAILLGAWKVVGERRDK